MALYTIVRRRVVSQVQTDEVEAATEEEALEIVNKAQAEEQFDYANEWHDLDDVIEYPMLDSDAILEVEDK